MKLSQKGSSIAIVLIVILIMGMIISTLIFTNRSHRKERSILETNIKLFYIAESGINHAFHKLLKNNYDNNFYAPLPNGKLNGKCGNGDYSVKLNNIIYNDKKAVKIISKAVLNKKEKVLEAIATFTSSRRIKMYCTYFCDEEVIEKWDLQYKIK